MNELQKEAKRLEARLRPLYSAVSDEILAGKTPGQALKDAGYYEEVQNQVLESVTKAVEFSATGTIFEISRQKFQEWYLNSNHLGGKLSDNIRTAEASTAIRGVLKKGLAIENSVNQLADTVQKASRTASDARLPKVLQQLVQESASGTPESIRKQIKLAERYVKGLGGPSRGSKQLEVAYRQLVNSAKSGKLSQEVVEKAISRKLRYINERIARTEMANAYEQGRRRAYDEDPNINAFEVDLSPEHPVADECDYIAEADLYGMGAGVYPLDSGVTVPIHPNCLCTTHPIRGDVKKGRYSEERSREYLSKADPKTRTRIIGKDTTLADSQKALKNKGIDPTNNTRAMMPKSVLQPKEGRV